MAEQDSDGLKRRDLLRMIGSVAGGSAMYQAMTSLGLAADSQYAGPIRLQGAPRGARVLVLGAGMAGLVAALELRGAGYKVELLDFNDRVGGRAWTLRGGDSYSEIGGETQHCRFDPGLYLNPGPWRVPYHHRAYLDYAKRFNVALEPFIMVNYNALVHSSRYFGGKPLRFREVQADFQGHVAELLAKCTQSDKLDQNVSKEDQEILLEALRSWGGLDKNFAYGATSAGAERRGYEISKGGGLMPAPLPSTPVGLDDLLRSDLWMALTFGQTHYWQSTIFQPVGGMDQTPKAIARQLVDVTSLNRKVVSIRQDQHGVAVTSVDSRSGRDRRDSHADWCVCTLPLTVLGQIELQVGDKMKAGIDAIAYSNGVKSGLQFKRRFWEEDDGIFGGISFTDLPIGQIAYPNFGYNRPGKGVLLGCFAHGVGGYELEALAPKARLQRILDYGAQLHPQYRTEFENGITVNWHRVPFTLGCGAAWTPELRAAHYRNLAEIDGRIVLAGDHISELTTWQEGAILSALDAIGRLHRRILAA